MEFLFILPIVLGILWMMHKKLDGMSAYLQAIAKAVNVEDEILNEYLGKENYYGCF